MYVEGVSISCGICQLAAIGDNPKQKEFDENMEYACRDGFGIVLASLTSDQKRAVKFLEKNKFRRSGKWKINPNSGNKIALFIKRIRGKPNYLA